MKTTTKNSTQRENDEPRFVGIDVAKDELVVHVLPTNKQLTVPNSQKGIKELVKLFKEICPKQIVFEATGGLERELLTNLAANGFAAVAINPRQARDLAKNDAIDAQLLAQFAKLQVFPERPVPSKEMLEMSDYIARRDDLITMRTMEKNRLQQQKQKELAKDTEKHIAFLDKQIANIDDAIDKMIAANTDWSDKDQIIQSVPGVGPKTSHLLIAALPELGHLNRQEIAALVGLAPFCNDSGTRSGGRHIRGGRADVRTALYMATMSAVRFNQTFKTFYERLRKNGKSFRVALVAAMRKMITILNVMLKTKTGWKDNSVAPKQFDEKLPKWRLEP